MHRTFFASLGAAFASAVSASALAAEPATIPGEVYGSVGLPGVTLGYAYPLADTITLRGDVSVLSIPKDGRKNGVDYTSSTTLNRAGLFADWFVSPTSGFRLTGGVTFNNMRSNINGQGTGQLVTVGNSVYLLTPEDRFNVHVKFPAVTPYVGIGWGHQPTGPSGWGFVFDLGASLGRAEVTGQASGPVFSSSVAQQDFDRELGRARNRASEFRFVPQLSVGVSYRF